MGAVFHGLAKAAADKASLETLGPRGRPVRSLCGVFGSGGARPRWPARNAGGDPGFQVALAFAALIP